MDTISVRYGPRFSRLFAEHINKIEAKHAAALAPGTSNWTAAINALHQRVNSVSSKKAVAVLNTAADFLHDQPFGERAAFLLSKHVGGSRNAQLILVSIGFGPHPDALSKEQGITLSLHLVESTRSRSRVLAGAPLGFISNHAVRRMHERDPAVTGYDHVIAALGLLSVLASTLSGSPQHRDGGIHLEFGGLLLVGAMHAKPEYKTTILDVRTALEVDELLPVQRPMLEQGRAATEMVRLWLTSDDHDLDIETLAARIPALPRRADNYLAALNREERPL
jgi:hypothetical protein